MNDVTYKDIPDYPGYRVGSDGSVWSCRVRGKPGGRLGPSWRRLAPRVSASRRPPSKGNYQSVLLHRADGGKRNHLIHLLVLGAFVGPRPAGMEACHGNGDPADNRLENLRWDTPENNRRDKRLHDTEPRGSRKANAKLTERDITIIRGLRAEGVMHRQIAAAFGVTKTTIIRIVQGKKWRHVA